MNRSAFAAAPGAALAAPTRPSFDRHLERCLILEEFDDGTEEIRTLLRERSPRFMEPTQ